MRSPRMTQKSSCILLEETLHGAESPLLEAESLRALVAAAVSSESGRDVSGGWVACRLGLLKRGDDRARRVTAILQSGRRRWQHGAACVAAVISHHLALYRRLLLGVACGVASYFAQDMRRRLSKTLTCHACRVHGHARRGGHVACPLPRNCMNVRAIRAGFRESRVVMAHVDCARLFYGCVSVFGGRDMVLHCTVARGPIGWSAHQNMEEL